MPSFEEILKKSVTGVSESRKAAEADLYEAVAIASESVEKIAAAKLTLTQADDDADATWFNLVLETPTEFYEIASFRLSGNGYPIKAGRSIEALQRGRYEAAAKDKDELTGYFVRLAEDPNSRLVLRLVFLLRGENSEGSESSSSDPLQV